MKNFVSFCFLIGFCFFARPADDIATVDAVKSTQDLILDKAEREKVLATDKKAKAADNFAKEAMGGDPQKTEELYGIAASLLPWIMKEAEGDPAKANAILQEAIANPKKLMERVPASEKAKIDDLAAKIEKKSPTKQSSPEKP